MATGMRTGRRTAASAMKSAAPAPEEGGGGPLGAVKKWWTGMPKKNKIILISSVVLVLIAFIAFNVHTAANKPVELFAGTISTGDASEIQRKLLEWNMPCQPAEGGKNILIHPKYKSMALLRLAQEGLPRRPVTITNDVLSATSKGPIPPTAEDKKKIMINALEGDMTTYIRQIRGVADAHVKIVPKKEVWGADDDKSNTSQASVVLRLYPDAKLSKQQIKGIVHLISSSVSDLPKDKITILNTEGRILNDPHNPGAVSSSSSSGGYTNDEIQQRDAMEKRLQKKVQTALDDFLGSGRSRVNVSVEMDFSQKERTITKYGGPTNTEGSIEVGRSEESEQYSDGSSSNNKDGNITQLSGTTGGSKSNYLKKRITLRKKVDKAKTRVVNTKPTIKRLTCSVMVDGVKDPKMLARLQKTVENSIGFDSTRNDQVSVVYFPKVYNNMLHGNASQGAGYSPAGWSKNKKSASVPSWLPVVFAIPILLVIAFVGLFYMKQKNVQQEKQRLILTSGPGTTVSDISDLLADKEGKVTAPPATKVNTTDQLENLAKEKPTKVAELLKSTWLADR